MKHLHTSKLFFLLLLTLFLTYGEKSALAETTEEYPADIAARIQQKYDQMTSLSFLFSQRSQGQIGGRPKTGSGNAYFSKNGKTSRMRWNYTAPDEQVLISDGTTFSMFFAELKQMIITPAENLDSDLTYSFFSGRARLEEKFYILPPDPEYISGSATKDQPKAIKLVPRESQSQVKSIHLWVAGDSLIRRIEMRDHFDTVTQLNLKDISVDFLAQESKATAEKLFSFTPPEGTEIIRQ
jgi:outer membrane lipoprotein carrier protein